MVPVKKDTTSTTTNPADIPTTPRAEDTPDRTVVLPELEKGSVVRRYALGPAELTGKALKTAQASFNQQGGGWAVDFTLTGEGTRQFGDLSTKYVGKQLAIVLDGVVKSAPSIRNPITDGRGQITGSFSQRQAKDLALVLRYGSLPVQLNQETVQTVSASLGLKTRTSRAPPRLTTAETSAPCT